MVAQFRSSTETWIVVSAPLEVNETGTRTGRIYKCSYTGGQCHPLPVVAPPEAGDISLGLSLAPRTVGVPSLLACGPTLSHECGTNMYQNGVCYLFNSRLKHVARYPPRTQDCFTARVDLAFLIDGSGSIVDGDFTVMKNFIIQMLRRFRHRDVQFAVMQFSDLVKKEFNFEEYELSSRNETLVRRIRQIKGDTYTPTAIKQLVEEIFVEHSGLRTDSKRVMVVITDGKSNDPDTTFSKAIRLAEDKQILRFAVGVGPDFQNAEGRQELEIIASNSTNNTVFSIKNFNALKTIQDQLQAKIFAIEGAHGSANLTYFKNEMSQEGFSSILTSDTVVLGSPGAYGWSGGVLLYRGDNETFVNISMTDEDLRNSYLGYSVQKATRAGLDYYIAGAPRYRHTGAVVIFQRGRNGTWENRQHIPGEQLGSYFGSELCTMDVNGDGETDLLLIGAPLHQYQRFGGMVLVCTMSPQGNFSCGHPLRGAEESGLGRFGSSVAALSDLNGDGLGDVAVGAPLEDEHRGRVYIFHGESGGIKLQYSQCLEGVKQSPSLTYFGQSVSGMMDVSGDLLTDLVIGSLGTVTVFRTRPVVNFSASAVFHPQPIPLALYRCHRVVETGSLISNVTVCLRMASLAPGNLGKLKANVTYNLFLDFQRQQGRATFSSFARKLTTNRLLSTKTTLCEQYTIHLLACVKDYLEPINLLLNFTLAGELIPASNGLRPILNQYSQTSYNYKLPFELDCGVDNQCVDFLKVLYNFSRGNTLLIGQDQVLTAMVSVENAHEDSDKPQLHFYYPSCLNFRKISSVQPANVLVLCNDVDNSRRLDLGSLTCDIDHPIFPKHSHVTFSAEFDISDSETEERTANFTITATSGNSVRITNESTLSQTLFLRYTVNVVTSGIEYTRHINVTAGTQEVRLVKHSYQVENLGDRSLPIGVTLAVPDLLSGQPFWNITVSSQNQTSHSVCPPPVERGSWLGRMSVQDRRDNVSEDCGIAPCVLLRCRVSELQGHKRLIVNIQGELRTEAITQLNVKELRLVTKLRLNYDGDKYVDVSNRSKEAVIVTEVDVVVTADHLTAIISGTLLGLLLLLICGAILYKLGFFRRNKVAEDHDQLQADSPPAAEGATTQC
ncbi:integrin alpha-X-like isoform X3 [Stegostoma tigrinum]|nr:integrin alpha-X-like isoform X3 [Stegostoma tigrinum]